MNDQEPIGQVASSKEEILASLKEHGYRLTEQRKLIVDIIANEEYTCCKEVYFLAHKRDNSIGIATVYRMINTLEEIGAISRKNIQKNNLIFGFRQITAQIISFNKIRIGRGLCCPTHALIYPGFF